MTVFLSIEKKSEFQDVKSEFWEKNVSIVRRKLRKMMQDINSLTIANV